MNKTTIVSSEVSKRNRDKQLLKEQQNKEMQLRQVERGNDTYSHTQSAFNDKHMINALKKVQESDVTVDTSYSRYQGSSLYTESIGQSMKKVERNALRKIKKDLSKRTPTDAVSKIEPIGTIKTIRPVETTSKKKQLKESLWKKICRQVGKPELTTNTLFESTNRWGVNVSALQRKRTI